MVTLPVTTGTKASVSPALQLSIGMPSEDSAGSVECMPGQPLLSFGQGSGESLGLIYILLGNLGPAVLTVVTWEYSPALLSDQLPIPLACEEGCRLGWGLRNTSCLIIWPVLVGCSQPLSVSPLQCGPLSTVECSGPQLS